MILRRVISCCLITGLFILTGCLSHDPFMAEDYNASVMRSNPAQMPQDGFIRLVVNERNGSFSLYYLANPEIMRYEPLFNAKDPEASFMSVYVDGKIYRLGKSRRFKTRFEKQSGLPAIVHESSFLKVTQVFTPIRTLTSPVVNGIVMTITIENKLAKISSVGLRVLLDTELSEERTSVPFITNTRIISSEAILDSNSEERFWITRGQRTSLMGSVVNPDNSSGISPDYVHIANWKRLNDTPWKLRYSEGRSFNKIPQSVRDSAVCYYFNPKTMEGYNSAVYTIFLTTEDIAWYNLYAPAAPATASILTPQTQRPAPAPAPAPAAPPPPPPPPAPVAIITPEPEPEIEIEEELKNIVIPGHLYIELPTIDIVAIEREAQADAIFNNQDVHTVTLVKLQEILNQFINGEIYLNEQDLIEIESAIERHKAVAR